MRREQGIYHKSQRIRRARHQIGKGLSYGGRMDEIPGRSGINHTAKSPTAINASNLTADSNAMVAHQTVMVLRRIQMAVPNNTVKLVIAYSDIQTGIL